MLKPLASRLTCEHQLSFLWYFVWLAAAGDLLGALVSSSADLFSIGFRNTWRGLVTGAIMGCDFLSFCQIWRGSSTERVPGQYSEHSRGERCGRTASGICGQTLTGANSGRVTRTSRVRLDPQIRPLRDPLAGRLWRNGGHNASLSPHRNSHQPINTGRAPHRPPKDFCCGARKQRVWRVMDAVPTCPHFPQGDLTT